MHRINPPVFHSDTVPISYSGTVPIHPVGTICIPSLLGNRSCLSVSLPHQTFESEPLSLTTTSSLLPSQTVTESSLPPGNLRLACEAWFASSGDVRVLAPVATALPKAQVLQLLPRLLQMPAPQLRTLYTALAGTHSDGALAEGCGPSFTSNVCLLCVRVVLWLFLGLELRLVAVKLLQGVTLQRVAAVEAHRSCGCWTGVPNGNFPCLVECELLQSVLPKIAPDAGTRQHGN